MRVSASSISPATPKNIGPAMRNTSTPGGRAARWAGSSTLVLGQHAACLAHARHEQQRGQRDAHPDRHRQIHQHCQRKGEQQQRALARLHAHQVAETLGFAHAPGHDQQDRRQGGIGT
jgi:hypothetical protein